MFRLADVFVMPNVSEPFGLAALEVISHGVPAIVSRQPGVAEVLDHVLKVDYWDVQGLAGEIMAVLGQPSLQASLRENSRLELSKLSWGDATRQYLEVYRSVMASATHGGLSPQSPRPGETPCGPPE